MYEYEQYDNEHEYEYELPSTIRAMIMSTMARAMSNEQ
jgi:hypothetical protein